ncbi:pimeloyl-ACP methyl ester carboxylesterase [Pseudonocardia eucalypti]|uniref:lipase/acyltransferase domain-containing protein n=1 Tax=Pseudonocardia eucalypti TaxID=648755 RepID=UPI0016164878|nr:pimeloyl-ACP methyl ester carboxylesterase [Pseudonocardia eucalypti]
MTEPAHAYATAAAANCSCPKVVDAQGNPLKVPPGKQPVLLVHGWGLPGIAWPFGNPSQWNGNNGLADQLDNKKNDYVVGRLDYSDIHEKWVTDGGSDSKSIAQRVAAAIKCLAKNTGKKVITVGHSMGGLAIQGSLDIDPAVAQNIAGIISAGTPWQGVPRDRINLIINAARLSATGLDVPLDFRVQFYLNTIAASSGLQAMEAGKEGKLSGNFSNLPKIPPDIDLLPVGGTLTAPSKSDDVNKQTLPLTDIAAGQQVNLVGTTVNLFGQIRSALVPKDQKASEAADPFVGINSATKPEAGGHVLTPIALDCKTGPFWCRFGARPFLGSFHSDIPTDPAFAERVMPTIEQWKQKNTHASTDKLANDPDALGNCEPTPTPAPTPPPPQQLIVDPPTQRYTPHCDDNEYLDHGDCKLRPVECRHNQIPDGHGGCKDKPCRDGQVRHGDGDCYDQPPAGGPSCRPGIMVSQGECGPGYNNGNPNRQDPCPNGMVRVSPATSSSSGCVVPGGGQQHTQCPPGQHHNNKGVCESDQLNQSGPCPDGKHRDKEGICRSASQPTTKTTPPNSQTSKSAPTSTRRGGHQAGGGTPSTTKKPDTVCKPGYEMSGGKCQKVEK